MPVEVKIHGRLYKDSKTEVDLVYKKFTHVCENCGCVFSFGLSDTKYEGWLANPKDPFKVNDYESIDCPECNHKCTFCNLKDKLIEDI